MVSVLIPCNDPLFLKEALASVLEQRLSEYEILVVLNGEEILESQKIVQYKMEFPKNVRWLYSHETGIVPSLNLGLNEAKFELIARLDADDVMLPNRLQHQIAHFRKDRHLVLLGSQIKIMKGSRSEAKYDSKYFYPDREPLVRSFLRRDASFAHPSVMYRNSDLQRIGGYSDKYPGIEDWELWIRLSELGRVYNCRAPLTAYRVHGEQFSQREKNQVIKSVEQMTLERFQIEISSIEKRGSVLQIENVVNCNIWAMFSTNIRKSMRVLYTKNTKAVKHKFRLLGVVLELKWTSMRVHKKQGPNSKIRYLLLVLFSICFKPSILVASLRIRTRSILRRFWRSEILEECLRDDHR